MTTITIYSHWADDPTGLAGTQLADPTWTGLVANPEPRAIFAAFNASSDRDARRLRAIGYWLPSLSVADVIILNSDTAAPTYHLVLPAGYRAISQDEYLRIRRDANPFQAAEQLAWFGALMVAA